MADFSEYGIPSKEWAAIEPTLPPFDKSISLEDLQASVNLGREEVARKDLALLAPKLEIKDHSIISRDQYALEGRTYRPKAIAADKELPIYLHFHGGGFCFGTLSSEDAICARICLSTDVVVLNINYRHTPEFGYPTAWNDAEDALDWILSNANQFAGDPSRIVVGGISAGGWLSASLTQATLKRKPAARAQILGQVLMIPALVYQDCYQTQIGKLKDPAVSSYVQNEFAPILSVERINQFNSLLKVGEPDSQDRRLNPGNATADEVRSLPPTTIGIAGCDPLRDEALFYGQLLAENGVPTKVHVFKGVPHGFRRFGSKLSVCETWDKVMEEGIRWALTKPRASGNFMVNSH